MVGHGFKSEGDLVILYKVSKTPTPFILALSAITIVSEGKFSL